MPANLIPALDPTPIPGPPWLFHVLWVVTFLVHAVFLNLALGGSLLAAVVGGARAGGRETRTLLVGVNAWAISLAITFGIAPLLFIQVLFGRFFYTATVLVGQAWLGLLVVLLVGYYLNYVAKYRLRAGKPVNAVLWIEALCFLAIAVIQVAVNLLHMQPGRWTQVAANAWVALADPAFVPRLLHFVLAATSMAGALVAWVAVRHSQKGGDAKALDGMARFGIRAALAATVLQLIDGFWLLMALPEPVLRSFMRRGAATLLPLTLGIVAGVLLLLVIAQISEPLQQATKVHRLAELIVGAMLFMIITRHELRAVYLAPARAGEQLQVAPQWGVFAVFLVVFLAGVGLTIYGMARAARDRAVEGEPAA
jgi:hypothetical protein